MSDRIYEKADQTHGSQSRNDEDPISPYNNQEDESPYQDFNKLQTMHNQPISPSNLYERKLPTLSIISEEDTQVDHHSVYLKRMTSGGESMINKRMSSNEFMQRLSSNKEEESSSKSRSFPMTYNMTNNTRTSRADQRRVSPMH